jgi:hypothetical protein
VLVNKYADHLSLYRQAQLSHQTKKYDSKSKYCGVWSDLGTTRAKVDQAQFEMHRAKTNGLALIFDVQSCELRSWNPDGSTSVSSRSILSSLERGRRFLAPQIDKGF